ncbi:type II secretion system protein N [Vibrio alfacsensis]|uniref:type II secretion system protein N n=1 Tax=Vibrio alfacsensis TaxID=1074311 RepID=UPI001BEE61BC|nr:type II secretion system protein N [Vibrio alfacsensis]WQE76347.1 type II secretion system protein N [Vibrio alfacsensis]BBM65947.1 general secretion pathway protein GspN [Vibrio alfacsensis]BCN22932.1 general secretion pathway protein GspN [Vibrio alfacsensis]
MKRVVLYVVIFITFFSASLIAGLPVSWVLQQAPKVRGLEIQGAQGTVWQGQASNVMWQRQNLGEVNWDFQLSRLFTGKVEFAVRFGRGSDMDVRGKGFVGYSLAGGPYAENLVASMPAEKVVEQARLPVPVGVDGQLELNIRHASYAAPWCKTGEGTLVWSASGIQSPLGSLDLGPVIADLNCKDSVLTASGEQQSKQVSAAFSAELQPNQRYSTKAWFKPGAEFPSGMSDQLKWLGNPNAQGQYEFNYQGRF